MLRQFVLFIALSALALALPAAADEPPADHATRVIIDTVPWTVEAHRGPLADDYEALAESSIAPDDPYAVKRGVNLGLIELTSADGTRRRQVAYRIKGERVRVRVRVRAEHVVPDWLDLLVTNAPPGLVVVRTISMEAGLFTSSTVWELGALAVPGDALDAQTWHEVDRELLAAALEALDPLAP